MPILYACVARGSTVLAEHASAQGNFAAVTHKILAKIPQTDGKQCYVYQVRSGLAAAPCLLRCTRRGTRAARQRRGAM